MKYPFEHNPEPMKIFHLALISVVACALQKEEIRHILDEIIENSINKIETESANFTDSGYHSSIVKEEVDNNEEVVVLRALEEEEIIKRDGNYEKVTDESTSINFNNQVNAEIVPVETENKTMQKPAPQNKFLLLFTSFMVMVISMIIAIIVGLSRTN